MASFEEQIAAIDKQIEALKQEREGFVKMAAQSKAPPPEAPQADTRHPDRDHRK